MAKAQRKPGNGVKGASAASGAKPAGQYIIQVCLGGATKRSRKLSVADIAKALAGTGVQLDKSYGPINVNPVEGNYVVRGWATPDARQRAEEQVRGIQFFSDAAIGPTGPPRSAVV